MMTTSPVHTQSPTPIWQPEKHLHSGDCVWILTDVESYSSSYYGWSEPRELFKVGVYDLNSNGIGFATFGRDIAFTMMRAELPPPPWKEPLPFGIILHRLSHDGEEKGRYVTTVELLPIADELRSILTPARRMFGQISHCPNSTPGMWDHIVARAAKENAIERAALAMTGPFSAGDVRTKIGDPDAEATHVLKRLVAEGKLLPPTGKKRGTRYQVATPLTPTRTDWVG